MAVVHNKLPTIDVPDFLPYGIWTAMFDRLANIPFPESLKGEPKQLSTVCTIARAHTTTFDHLPIAGIAKEKSTAVSGTANSAGAFPRPSTASSPLFLGPHFIADAAATAAPAVVNITVSKDGLPVPQDHSGTGFIYSTNGCILTNAHVIADALPSSDLTQGHSSNATSCSNNTSHSSSSNGASKASSSKPITVALQDGRIFQGSVLMFDRCSLMLQCCQSNW